MEKDSRVLEALKVGQVHTDADSFLGPAVREHPTSLGIHIAGGLSVIYLPPIPPPATTSPTRKQPTRPRPKPHFSTTSKAAGMKPMRTISNKILSWRLHFMNRLQTTILGRVLT